MGNTLSMSHPPVFVSEPNLTPSDKKLGRGAWGVFFETTETTGTKETTTKHSIKNSLCCLFSQKRRSLLTITNYSLLITNCIFAPSDKKLGRGAWGVFFETTETTETKETTAKQSIIRMIINFSVISVVPTVSVVSFLKKGAAF